MKKLLKTIFHQIVWFFDNLGWLIICGIVIAMVTTIELLVFNIPNKYGDVILIGNTVITILIYLYAVSTTKNEYEEKLNYFSVETVLRSIHGSATEEEVNLYETELKEIVKKYSGEEAFHKQREFIVKQRVELILSKIKSY